MTTPSPAPRATPSDFRKLLGCFATGVTVATAKDADGRLVGMTASAVSAVSLDPPLLLICVGHSATFHRALRGGTGFALNILATDQQALSEHFASGFDDPFEDTAYHIGDHGFPLLDGVVAHIICGQWSAYEAGDHTVFFGEVIAGQAYERPPLIHYRGRYTTTQD
jgi:flavin reductase (DIM6/NTAB) family NADH-FMN oxidoreductase RutF